MKFYYLQYAEKNEYGQYGVAYVQENVNLFILPMSGIRVTSWSRITFTLKDGSFPDYLANDLGCRLCSGKLKEIINKGVSEKDEMQWLETLLLDENGNKREYYILHFPVNFTILDKKKSIIVDNDVIVKPVLDNQSVKYLNIFTLPNNFGITTFVSENLKKLIENQNCSGISFLEAKQNNS